MAAGGELRAGGREGRARGGGGGGLSRPARGRWERESTTRWTYLFCSRAPPAGVRWKSVVVLFFITVFERNGILGNATAGIAQFVGACGCY